MNPSTVGPERSSPAEERGRSPYRWVVLLAFFCVAGVSQMLWLNFAPLLSLIQNRYGVTELVASSLVLVFPLLYVLLSIPAGALIDRRGYRFSIGLGAVVMAGFSCLRIYTGSFAVLLVAQIGIAVAQPYIINGITKLAADWFAAEDQALADGLGTAGMFFGMALGMALTPALVESAGLTYAMLVFAAISVLSGAFFLVAVRETGRKPSAGERENKGPLSAAEEFRLLVSDKKLLLIFALSFLALGFFNGLSTWLEKLLGGQGIGAADAGLVGGVLIIGGIFGALLIPALSDKARRRKPFLLFCGLAGVLLTYPVCTGSNLNWLYLLAGLLGFFFLPGYALLLAMSEEVAGAERAGGAAGVLMLAGNAGGVVVPILMEQLQSPASGWLPAVYLLMGILVCVLVLALFVPETFGSASDSKSLHSS